MKTKLKYENFRKYLIDEIDRSNLKNNLELSKILNKDSFNFQWIFNFKNGYGASVIKSPSSYGFDDDLFELAVLKFENDIVHHITYDTPVTSDVIGYLTNDEVLEYLEKIKNLKDDEE